MPLSDRQILGERDSGNLVIEPFDRGNLGSDTYDVRLGEFFYRETQTVNAWYDPWSEASASRVWGVPFQAQVAGPASDGVKVIVLEPGETILAHTIEFIGARRGFTTKMFSRSSIGRSMLGVCKCAGRGDVGYFNRWTFEITSFSRYNKIVLRVGMRIAQIEFLPVAETERTYGVTHGKYQDGDDLAKLMTDWRPELMLPRLHNDWELAK